MVDAATLLSQQYDLIKKTDSAYKYNKLASATKDSMHIEEQMKEVQSLKYKEQSYQQDQEIKKAAEKKERKDNLQFLGIAIFIITLFAVLILLSRRKSKPRALQYLGLVGLLLLFEFVTIFLHPFIAKFSSYTPVFILIISVAVAFLLAPIHTRLTDWVQNKLGRKPTGRHGKKNDTIHHKPKARNYKKGKAKDHDKETPPD
jgi:ABC-type uncharacterized transport system fused permease/ATPase subunit